MNPLHELAQAAGLQIHWRDVNGIDQTVSDESLRAVLGALGLPAETAPQIIESAGLLREELRQNFPKLITAEVGEHTSLAGSPGLFRIVTEAGRVIDGHAQGGAGRITLPPVGEPGYHRLELQDFVTTLAVAPKQAYRLEDAAPPGHKLWGLAVQLYGLRRAHDGGIGDFAALEEFARRAAQAGAAAVAISPVHAQFSANFHHYSPYAPSNRAAFNVLHIAQDAAMQDDGGLVDWPRAAAAKLALLREIFAASHDHEALDAFRAQAGSGLERHVTFEALAASLTPGHPAALDWRNWPADYQHPENPAVTQFIQENPDEIAFHAWLQWRADQGLAAAHAAARGAGARIGLITDLAVGTSHAGSASWSQPDEVLKNLEFGAPPDFINREGQSWGITGFSPRGLRNGGFGGFIGMLRHALRHAGGVRIDHVMGLARVWVIPAGFRSAQGAYLTMPADELMRLIRLELQRHKAVILGEDLGTLPCGFDAKLNAAGIAGLRVLWFEHDGDAFKPPSAWTPSAVAMSTTHDLPTVAGWWLGNDIAWRQKLHMQGETEAARADSRAALWSAFQKSGAATGPQPPPADGDTASLAAASHLGRAACTLALLPVEDALSLSEQPNLPGTSEEHPNWRRRLPGNAETLFARQDFQARLAALAAARRRLNKDLQ